MESMVDKVRRMAMRDEGISDDEMTQLQGEKLIRKHLEELAAVDAAEAIRAATRPRRPVKKPASSPAPSAVARPAAPAWAEQAIQRQAAPQRHPLMREPGGYPGLDAFGGRGAIAQAAQAGQSDPEKQGLLALLLSLLSGGGESQTDAAPSGGWRGPAMMQNSSMSRILPPMP